MNTRKLYLVRDVADAEQCAQHENLEQTVRSGQRFRKLSEASSKELWELQPPTDVDTLRWQWQHLVYLRAQELQKRERLEHLRGLRKHRPKPPLAEAEFDSHVLGVLASERFTSQQVLRERIGCNLARLRNSLQRLMLAGRIVKDGVVGPWRVVR